VKSRNKKCRTPTKLAIENDWLAVRKFACPHSPETRSQTMLTNKGLDALRRMLPKAPQKAD
jgi:hypothetical protein